MHLWLQFVLLLKGKEIKHYASSLSVFCFFWHRSFDSWRILLWLYDVWRMTIPLPGTSTVPCTCGGYLYSYILTHFSRGEPRQCQSTLMSQSTCTRYFYVEMQVHTYYLVSVIKYHQSGWWDGWCSPFPIGEALTSAAPGSLANLRQTHARKLWKKTKILWALLSN